MTDKNDEIVIPPGAPTRGEGMPGTRSGSRGRGASEIERKREERTERRTKDQQERDLFRQREALEAALGKKVTWQELGAIVQDINQKMFGTVMRVEASIHALKRRDPGFALVFEDSLRRQQAWYEAVRSLKEFEFTLPEWAGNIRQWNLDVDNPPITYEVFGKEKLEKIFRQDTAWTYEEKADFLEELKIPEGGVLAILGAKPADDGAPTEIIGSVPEATDPEATLLFD